MSQNMDTDSDVEIVQIVPASLGSAGAPLEVSSDEENGLGVEALVDESDSDSDIEIIDANVASPALPEPATPQPPALLATPPPAPPTPVSAAAPSPRPATPASLPPPTASSVPPTLVSIREEDPPSPTSRPSRLSQTPSAPDKSSSNSARRLLNPPVSKVPLDLSPLLTRTSSSEGSTSSADDKNSGSERSDTEKEESSGGKVSEEEGASSKSEEPEETEAASSGQQEPLVTKSLSFRQALGVLGCPGFPNTCKSQESFTHTYNKSTIQIRALTLKKALEDTIVSQDVLDKHLKQLDLATEALSDGVCDGRFGKGEVVWAFESPRRGYLPAIIVDGRVEEASGASELSVSFFFKPKMGAESVLWEKNVEVVKALEHVSPFVSGWNIANTQNDNQYNDDLSVSMREKCIEEAVKRFLREHKAPPVPRADYTRWTRYFDAAHKAVKKAVSKEPLTSHIKKSLAPYEKEAKHELTTAKSNSKAPPPRQLKSPPAAAARHTLPFGARLASSSKCKNKNCNRDSAKHGKREEGSNAAKRNKSQHVLLSTESVSTSTDRVVHTSSASMSMNVNAISNSSTRKEEQKIGVKRKKSQEIKISQHTLLSTDATSTSTDRVHNVSMSMNVNTHSNGIPMSTNNVAAMSINTNTKSSNSAESVPDVSASSTRKRKSTICPDNIWCGHADLVFESCTRGAKRRHIQSEAARHVEAAQDDTFPPDVQRRMKDFSRKKEPIPIRVQPTRDAAGNMVFPKLGKYIIEARGNRVKELTEYGCECEGDCSKNENKCRCGKLNGEANGLPYQGLAANILKTTHSDMRRFECGPNCSCTCNKGGVMRLAQGGVNARLEIFHTGKKKGWGARTLQYLPQGYFVCVYAGEIVEDVSDDVSEDNVYLFEVARPGSENRTWGVDASKKGNVARFINHSHSPNLALTKISCGYEYELLAFFTKCEVFAGTELTWQYSKGERRVAGQERTPCECGCVGQYLA